MKAAWIIARREIFSFFLSPMAYVVFVAWLLWSGIGFFFFCQYYQQNVSMGASDSPLAMFFGGTILFFVPLLAIVPALTMRLIAEETRTGSLESLLTAPVSDASIVLGKYLAALVFWCALWLPTLLYVWLTSRYGQVDMGQIGASYLGIFGIGVYYMAIGLLMSAIAPNQIIAFVLTFGVLGLLFVLGVGQFFFDEPWREVLAYMSVWGHMSDFSKGIVDSRYLVYDLSLAGLALFLAVRALEGRRLA